MNYKTFIRNGILFILAADGQLLLTIPLKDALNILAASFNQPN